MSAGMTKAQTKQYVERVEAILRQVDEMKVLIGRRIVGVGFTGEGEGTYILTFDDGSTATFSSSGDDATFTSLELSEFQKSITK
jgi:hypothetical protein